MNSVRMFGPLGSASGYANAVRNFALAFSKSEIPTKFHFGQKAEAEYSLFMESLKRYSGDTNIDFYLHGPPWSTHRSRAYKIGYFYWEADRLPLSWERMISQVNELWVPCQLVEQACRKAKFKGPIKLIPTPSDPWETNQRLIIPSDVSNQYIVSDDVFKFYSIFQWHERKGYKELLQAYYKTFNEDDNVILILKVNPLNIRGYTRDKIKVDIMEIKRRLNQKYFPRVYLSRDILNVSHIQALHNTADCYVSAHHGEGWGVPIHDAMLAENHLIVPKFGGVTDYLDENSANLVDFKIGPVSGMEWSNLYGSYQNWAYPGVNSLSQKMREVFDNPLHYYPKTIKAKEIAETMTTSAVARLINKELIIPRKSNA